MGIGFVPYIGAADKVVPQVLYLNLVNLSAIIYVAFILKKNIFKDYYSWKEADEYLNSYGLSGHDRFPQCQIIDYETGRKYCHRKAKYKLQKEDIFKKWKEGSTFVLSLSEFLNKKLWKQCEHFEE